MSHVKLASLANANSGDVVSFDYLGENDYKPKKRFVIFSGQLSGGLAGSLDLQDHKKFKNFKVSNATNVQKLASATDVVKTHNEVLKEFAKAPRDVQRLGLDAVAKWLVPNADSVEYVSEADLYVVQTKQEKPRLDIKKIPNGYMMTWVNRQGKSLDFDWLGSNSGVMPVENLIKTLAKHYGV